MSRNTILAIVAVVLLVLAAFFIYRASRPPVQPLTPEEMEALKKPGPLSPQGGGATGSE